MEGGLAVIGAGAVGSALACRLAGRGVAVRAVVSRSEAGARRLADAVGAPVASTTLDALPPDVGTVCCCVPDAVVGPVAAQLFLLPRSWQGCLVVHTAGALTTDALAPLDALGARTLSLHPLQSFTPRSGPEAFDGIYVVLQGSAPAVDAGRAFAALLGAMPVVLSAEEKVRCHLAASIASNFTVTLMAMAAEVLATAGVDRAQGADMLRPLVDGTWRNLARQPPEDALTGPIARGDHGTLGNHLAELARHTPGLLPAYAAMAVETIRVAVRGGRLDQPQAQQLLDLLLSALEPGHDAPL